MKYWSIHPLCAYTVLYKQMSISSDEFLGRIIRLKPFSLSNISTIPWEWRSSVVFRIFHKHFPPKIINEFQPLIATTSTKWRYDGHIGKLILRFHDRFLNCSSNILRSFRFLLVFDRTFTTWKRFKKPSNSNKTFLAFFFRRKSNSMIWYGLFINHIWIISCEIHIMRTFTTRFI